MSLGDFGRDMLAEAARIAEQTVARDGTHLRWATITDTDPLRIRYDGEPNASIVTPQNTVAGLRAGDRVAVGKQHGQALIVGRAGGGRFLPELIEGQVPLDKLPIAAGVVTIPGGGGSFVSATVTLPAGRFKKTPVVTATANNSKMNAYYSDSGMSPTSVRVGWRHIDDATFTASFDVAWTAVEP